MNVLEQLAGQCSEAITPIVQRHIPEAQPDLETELSTAFLIGAAKAMELSSVKYLEATTHVFIGLAKDLSADLTPGHLEELTPPPPPKPEDPPKPPTKPTPEKKSRKKAPLNRERCLKKLANIDYSQFQTLEGVINHMVKLLDTSIKQFSIMVPVWESTIYALRKGKLPTASQKDNLLAIGIPERFFRPPSPHQKSLSKARIRELIVEGTYQGRLGERIFKIRNHFRISPTMLDEIMNLPPGTTAMLEEFQTLVPRRLVKLTAIAYQVTDELVQENSKPLPPSHKQREALKSLQR